MKKKQWAAQLGKQEVIKYSAAIQIENNMTLLQRRVWNALLYNAYNQLEKQDEYEIPLTDLAILVGYSSHDMEYLREASVAMLRCIVQYNILGKDGGLERWSATALLAQADIQRQQGLFVYAYSPELRRRLHNPEMYARLDLDLQKQFDSKYALALWELCTDYLGSGRDYGETPFIAMATFRKLMGVVDEMYPGFMRLNERVVKPAIIEVNRVSDFHVTMESQRQGRKVIALKFKMRRVALLPEVQDERRKVFSDLDDMPMLVKELREAGLSLQDALVVWQEGFTYVEARVRPVHPGEEAEAAFTQYIREKIHLLKRRQEAGKIGNRTGFLLEAIRKNYANPEFARQQQKEAAQKEKEEKREKDKQRRILETQKRQLEEACDKAVQKLCSEIFAAQPEQLEDAAQWAIQEVQGFHLLYNRHKTARENYQTSPAVQALLNPYLERHDADRFEAVRNLYAVDIATIDTQIVALTS